MVMYENHRKILKQMRKKMILSGIVLLSIASILFLIPVPTHLGLTLYDLHEHCISGTYLNYQDAPNCIDTTQRVNVTYAVSSLGLIFVVTGTSFPPMKKKWLVSTMACLFFGIRSIIVHFNSYQNIWCWYNGWGQVHPLPPEPFMDAYFGVYNCYGFLNGFILGICLLAGGVLILFITQKTKSKINHKKLRDLK